MPVTTAGLRTSRTLTADRRPARAMAAREQRIAVTATEWIARAVAERAKRRRHHRAFPYV